jgi:hypothetical protein
MNENTWMKMNLMNDTHNIHEIDNMNNKNITWMKFTKWWNYIPGWKWSLDVYGCMLIWGINIYLSFGKNV